jgi:hypothetical protein
MLVNPNNRAITRRVPLVEQELFTLTEHLSSSRFSEVLVARSWVFFFAVFSRWLFVLLFFFFWTLYCLSFDLRILITLLVYSNSSNTSQHPSVMFPCIVYILQVTYLTHDVSWTHQYFLLYKAVLRHWSITSPHHQRIWMMIKRKYVGKNISFIYHDILR